MTNDLEDEVSIAEKVEEIVSEVLADMSGRWRKKPFNKKNEDGKRLHFRICKKTRKDKNKEDNRVGNNGETLKCITFDSKKHLLPHCPYLWENMVNFVEDEISNE